MSSGEGEAKVEQYREELSLEGAGDTLAANVTEGGRVTTVVDEYTTECTTEIARLGGDTTTLEEYRTQLHLLQTELAGLLGSSETRAPLVNQELAQSVATAAGENLAEAALFTDTLSRMGSSDIPQLRYSAERLAARILANPACLAFNKGQRQEGAITPLFEAESDAENQLDLLHQEVVVASGRSVETEAYAYQQEYTVYQVMRTRGLYGDAARDRVIEVAAELSDPTVEGTARLMARINNRHPDYGREQMAEALEALTQTARTTKGSGVLELQDVEDTLAQQETKSARIYRTVEGLDPKSPEAQEAALLDATLTEMADTSYQVVGGAGRWILDNLDRFSITYQHDGVYPAHVKNEAGLIAANVAPGALERIRKEDRWLLLVHEGAHLKYALETESLATGLDKQVRAEAYAISAQIDAYLELSDGGAYIQGGYESIIGLVNEYQDVTPEDVVEALATVHVTKPLVVETPELMSEVRSLLASKFVPSRSS